MRRINPHIAVLLLLILALGFISDGLWIYTKAQFSQVLIKQAWEKTLSGENAVKPWPWADTWPVARLQSETVGVDLYVLQGVHGSALAFGPGYMRASAPLGSNGASVIAGHRDSHFQFLQNLDYGDLLKLSLKDGSSRSYRVTSLSVVDSHKQQLLENPTHATIVLVTCYPFNAIAAGGPLRYVVRAKAV